VSGGRTAGGTGEWRLPGASLLLAGLALAVALVPHAATWLEYDRAAIAGGQAWRLLTGHWAHWSWGHVAWDLLAFVALGVACERLSPGRFLACVAGSALLVSLVVWWLLPGMERYRGLSGIDSALLVLLAVSVMQQETGSRWLVPGAWALVGFLAKVTYESVGGHALFVPDGDAAVVPLAHLAGAAIGLGVGLTARPISPSLSPAGGEGAVGGRCAASGTSDWG
jgi:rhomboid family GlyGly-CTERM serine protease